MATPCPLTRARVIFKTCWQSFIFYRVIDLSQDFKNTDIKDEIQDVTEELADLFKLVGAIPVTECTSVSKSVLSNLSAISVAISTPAPAPQVKAVGPVIVKSYV